MAIDMSGESSSSTITSPRISFSHDLHHQSDGPDESEYRDFDDDDDDDFDFDFCINTSSADAAAASSSTAEDLFLDGKIRSLQLQDKLVILPTNQFPLIPIPIPIPIPPNGISNQETEQKKYDLDVIKRSNSLHCDHKKSSFWSTLQLLSRSNSTGSVPKPVKENPKSKQLKNSTNSAQSSSAAAAATRKPPLRKNHVGYYNKGNGMRISPLLNVSTPNISKKTANLLGLGTFFGTDQNKDKRIKK